MVRTSPKASPFSLVTTFNVLQSMNKETGNEMKGVDLGDINYKKGNAFYPAENFNHIFTSAKKTNTY
jgi:hypothetical protein